MSLQSILVAYRAAEPQMARPEALRKLGFEVFAAELGNEAVRRTEAFLPDLVVIESPAADRTTFQWAQQMRRSPHAEGVLVLVVDPSPDAAEEELGFHIPTRCYVSHATTPLELAQQIRGLLREQEINAEAQCVESQGLRIDRWRFEATIDERPLDLTPTEFRLLWTLIRQPGRAFSRSELADACGSSLPIQQRTVDVHVKAIRRKLGEHGDLIETVRGIGYRFREPRMARRLA